MKLLLASLLPAFALASKQGYWNDMYKNKGGHGGHHASAYTGYVDTHVACPAETYGEMDDVMMSCPDGYHYGGQKTYTGKCIGGKVHVPKGTGCQKEIPAASINKKQWMDLQKKLDLLLYANKHLTYEYHVEEEKEEPVELKVFDHFLEALKLVNDHSDSEIEGLPELLEKLGEKLEKLEELAKLRKQERGHKGRHGGGYGDYSYGGHGGGYGDYGGYGGGYGHGNGGGYGDYSGGYGHGNSGGYGGYSGGYGDYSGGYGGDSSYGDYASGGGHVGGASYGGGNGGGYRGYGNSNYGGQRYGDYGDY